MSLRILSAQAIQQVVTMPEAIAVMKDAFRQLASGDVYMPLRTHIPIPKHQALTLSMPAYASTTEELGIKIVSLFPDNIRSGLPTINGVVFLFNAKTGQPKALLEGSFLTALRTGAVSGLATDLLANPSASSLAIIGSGVQAQTQVEAVCSVRPITSISIYSRNYKHAEKFADVLKNTIKFPSKILVTHSIRDASKDADIICTATSSTTPFLDIQDVKPGVHINAIGSHTENMSEIAPGLVTQSNLVVDLRSAALAEAGEIIQCIRQHLLTEDRIKELGEVILNPALGRQSKDQITLFKSVGVAIQDISIAEYISKIATEKNQGTVIEM